MENTVSVKNLFTKNYLWRYCLLLLLGFLGIFGSTQVKESFFNSLADAYLQVTVFVAFTLGVFYGLEKILNLDTEKILKKYKQYQIPISAFIGALPGCGGAIVIMTQYSMGRLGFGSVIAVLTSTMGDAAFLLLAKEPKTALLVFAICLFVGITFGYFVEKIHGYDFLKPTTSAKTTCTKDFSFGKFKWPWVMILIPGIVLGLMTAFQIDIDLFFGIENLYRNYGVFGAMISLLLWFLNPISAPSVNNRFDGNPIDAVWDKTTIDTCFVTVWVILAYLLYEIGDIFIGWDLKELFSSMAVAVPLISVLIGFIPGCGPQVLVTSLYLDGLIPLSSQVGNAISNDGDALFPAMAVSGKASIVATLYTAIPALIVAYTMYFFFE